MVVVSELPALDLAGGQCIDGLTATAEMDQLDVEPLVREHPSWSATKNGA